MFESFPLILAQDGQDAVDTGPPNSPTTLDGVSSDGQAVTSQDGSTVVPTNTTNKRQDSPFGGNFMYFILLIFIVMMIFMSLSQRKEKKKRAALIAAVSKGAKIKTVGGILGTVVEVRDDEVIVKVDENANTRLRFDRTAIQHIIDDGGD